MFNFNTLNKMYFLFALTIILSCGTNSNPKVAEQKINDESEWIFDRVDSSNLIFKNGHTFNTNLYQLKYIGQIPVGNKNPYLIFSGVDCNECDANISIYIHSPSDGELSVGHGQNSYSYPGKVKYYLNDSLIFEASAFYGEVLKGVKGVIWYQKELTEDGNWKSSIFLVNVSGESKAESLLTDSGQFKETAAMVNQGRCTEIKGIIYHSEP